MFCRKQIMGLNDHFGHEKDHLLAKLKIDRFKSSGQLPFSVIPAKAGIQSFQSVTEDLDSGFHRSDDFLRDRQD
jgi:hypothetical protein